MKRILVTENQYKNLAKEFEIEISKVKAIDEVESNGIGFDPKTGKTYSCQVQLKSSQILEVKGYIGFSLIGRTVEWTKVKR